MEDLGCLESFTIMLICQLTSFSTNMFAILFRMKFLKCSYRSKVSSCHIESLPYSVLSRVNFSGVTYVCLSQFCYLLCSERKNSPPHDQMNTHLCFLLGAMASYFMLKAFIWGKFLLVHDDTEVCFLFPKYQPLTPCHIVTSSFFSHCVEMLPLPSIEFLYYSGACLEKKWWWQLRRDF